MADLGQTRPTRVREWPGQTRSNRWPIYFIRIGNRSDNKYYHKRHLGAPPIHGAVTSATVSHPSKHSSGYCPVAKYKSDPRREPILRPQIRAYTPSRRCSTRARPVRSFIPMHHTTSSHRCYAAAVSLVACHTGLHTRFMRVTALKSMADLIRNGARRDTVQPPVTEVYRLE